MNELQEIETRYQTQSLGEYRIQLREAIARNNSMAQIEYEHLHTQLRNSIPSKEQFWINRINIWYDVVQNEYYELFAEVIKSIE